MRSLLLAVLLQLIPVAQAADIDNGKKLHNENCTRCHDSGVYTRPYPMVRDLDQLRERIKQCELAAELTWFDEEVDDVVAYLDKYFYHFEAE